MKLRFCLPLLLLACDKSHTGPSETDSPIEDAFLQAPRLEMNDNEAAPLVGLLHVTTAEPTSLSVQMACEGTTWTTTFEDVSTVHEQMLLGFWANCRHELSVSATDASGVTTTWPTTIVVETPDVSAALPDLVVEVSEADLMEPGVTVVTLRANPYSDGGSHMLALNEVGRVVYTLSVPGVAELWQSPRGTWMGYFNARNELVELDMWGRELRRWHTNEHSAPRPGSIPIDVASMHHDLTELPNGNFLFLSSELRVLGDYPSSASDPNAPTILAPVVADVIVEAEPDGTVVNRHRIADILDIRRMGHTAFTSGWWDDFYETRAVDWSHGNSVFYSESDDTIVASFRHQDAVVKLTRDSGELVWIAAPDANWTTDHEPWILTPSGSPFQHTYHQHAAHITNEGTLLLFDNGNEQASAFEPTTNGNAIDSRAVEFRVEPDTGQITQIWEWKALDEPNFVGSEGSVQPLPTTNNVLINYGKIKQGSEFSAVLVEVSKAAPSQVVWQVHASPSPFSIYRARRITSLYP